MEDQDTSPGLFGSDAPATKDGGYRVLARKYRPTRFSDLLGQEAMVRTLTNAIATGRLAHAWILTGVRGIGKTTTARIIARALNCTGADGKSGPTPEPCGVCSSCVSIAQDRNIDVIEIDAASNTGVDNIREIIDGVRYAPVVARYKIYIIDEVHMLSKNAFNALLKTLEEPPAHAKFIFATTEIRKVPITVLSRCQRFDLRRFDAAMLADHFRKICALEKVAIEEEALALIARAADGSARDGLSLLDQAIARAGHGKVATDDVRAMLGLGDRDRIFRLFRALVAGDAPGLIDQAEEMHKDGADPVSVLQDLAEIVHLLTRVRITPALAEDRGLPEFERTALKELSGQLSVAALARLWQMLLKGLGETQGAAQPQLALEMALIRLCYAAQLPTPAEAIQNLQNADSAPIQPRPSGVSLAAPQRMAMSEGVSAGPIAAAMPASGGTKALAVGREMAVAAQPQPQPQMLAEAIDFPALVQMFADQREAALYALLQSGAHLIRLEPGHLEIRAEAHLPQNFSAQIARCLTDWTGRRWIVSLSNQAGAPTLKEQADLERQEAMNRAMAHPVVAATILAFPGAKITNLKRREIVAAPIGGDEDTDDSPLESGSDFGQD